MPSSSPGPATRSYRLTDYLLFWWVFPWLRILGKRRAGVDETPPLPENHLIAPLRAALENQRARGRRILPSLFCLFGPQVAARTLLSALLLAIPLALSPLMKTLIERISSREAVLGSWPLVLAMMLLPLFRSVLFLNLFIALETQIIRRCALLFGGAVAAKVLRLAPEERETLSSGTIISLANRDSWRVSTFCTFPDLILNPLAALAAAAWLIHLLGWAFAPAVGILALYVPLRARIIARLGNIVDELWAVNRERISAVTETLNSIESIKLFALEKVFVRRVSEVQERQARVIVRRADLQVSARVIDFLLPTLLSLVCIPLHAYLVPTISVATLFAVVAAFDALADVVGRLPDLTDNFVDARQAARRLEEFLGRAEAPGLGVAALATGSVRISGARPLARPGHFDLEAEPGQLVCIVGSVGAGKSTLLGLVAGQVRAREGAVAVSGRVSWCPSRPWIINGSVRENLTCEEQAPESRVRHVLRAVALDEDMAFWEKGLDTEIGERGINLSGGQRARLALARAALLDRDVAVLDDPYSALDPRVANHVHRELVCGVLAGKTRVLSTHRLEFAADADVVVVLEDGKVVETGDPRVLLAHPDSRFSRLSRLGEERRHAAPPLGSESRSPQGQEREDGAALVQSATLSSDEDVLVPKANWGAAWHFCRLMAPGMLLAVYFTLVFSRRASTIGGEGWLAYWGSHPGLAVAVGAGVYAVIQLAYMAMEQTQFAINLRGGARASTSLHVRMLESVVEAPKSFFDATPVGRIVNRFANDYSEMENALPMRLGGIARVGTTATLSLVAVALASPAVLLLFPAVVLATVWAFRRVRAPAVRLWQLQSLNRSLAVSRLTECFEGAAVVQAAGLTNAFLKSYDERQQNVMRVAHASFLVSGWQMTQNFLFGALFVAVAALMVIWGGFAGLSVAITAVALNNVLQITEKVGGLAQAVRGTEQLLASLERVLEYSQLPSEHAGGGEPPEQWPRSGALELQEVEVRYRPELAPVLRGACLTVANGEKVGIVGRTGAGKSTLFLALTRMLEPAAGRILLDGVDVATLRRDALRRAMTIIPQEPVLFAGTLRFNLDPEGAFSDGDLVKALEEAHLLSRVREFANGLDTVLGDGGLSSGERQLLCFARAILRRSKLILLDEATSGIDTVTDGKLQETIRTAFADATILTIAHRAETIAGCGRVVEVLDGRFVERWSDAGQRKSMAAPATATPVPTHSRNCTC